MSEVDVLVEIDSAAEQICVTVMGDGDPQVIVVSYDAWMQVCAKVASLVWQIRTYGVPDLNPRKGPAP